MTEKTFSVHSRAAEKIVRELGKQGIETSLGARHGDATIINISPEQWHAASDTVHRVNAGLSAKQLPDITQILAVGGMVAGGLALFGWLPAVSISAAPYIFGAVVVAGIWESLYGSFQAWRQHGRQLPKQTWEDDGTYNGRVKSGRITRWFSWGCSAVVIAFFVLLFAAIMLANGLLF
jgi:hypothetical protein